MTTITEDYVSFKIAKLLKEKGFDCECSKFYMPSGHGIWKYEHYHDFDISDRIECPTIQMVMKWLREVHNCSIEITSNGYLMDNDATWECDIKFRHRLYFRHIQCEKTYEDCAEAAIKYTLENLI